MQHQELDAPEELSHQVSGIWYREMDFGASPMAFEVLPDGNAELIFHFGNGCSLLIGGQPQALPSPFMVGLLKQPVYFQAEGHLQIIGVKCHPWAVYELLALSAIQRGVQSLTHPIAALQPALKQLLDLQDKAGALEMVRDWLIKNAVKDERALITKAGKVMREANGALPVSSVAAAAHATVRTLERQFKASSGHTVKDVSSLIRFEQARDRLWEEPHLALAGLAEELGYADQSHLNREFKRYSGLTAGAFARQSKNRKKQLSGDFVAIVLSSS